jgi:hypothetical protein
VQASQQQFNSKRGNVSWSHLLQDEMLPPEHMLQLYNVLKAAGSKRVVWTEFPTGNHMETYELCRQEYWPAVRAFFEQNIASGAADDVDCENAYSHAAPLLPYSRELLAMSRQVVCCLPVKPQTTAFEGRLCSLGSRQRRPMQRLQRQQAVLPGCSFC